MKLGGPALAQNLGYVMTASVQNEATFDGWSHVIYDLSKTARLIQGQKCLKWFFEIRSLSKVMRKIAPFLKH